MLKFRLAKPMLLALAACAGTVATCGAVFADDDQTQALKEQMRIMQQQMQQLQKQIDALSSKQTAPEVAARGAARDRGSRRRDRQGGEEKMSPLEKKFDNFLKGFYGSLDVSVDYTTKGIYNPVAYPWGYASGAPGQPVCDHRRPKAGPYGRVGWLGAMSSNGSSIGYRGHASRSAPRMWTSSIKCRRPSTWWRRLGCRTPGRSQSNTVQGAIGLGDTFLGFQNHSWGKVKFGEMYMPYKTSTDRLNPFGIGPRQLRRRHGEHGRRQSRRVRHARRRRGRSTARPPWFGLSFDAAYQFGQQLDPNSDLTPLGSPDCNGSNIPGSGNLFLNCDDGGYDRAYSADLKFEMGGLYLVGPTRFTSG